MYRVIIEEYSPTIGTIKTYDLLIKTERLFELIGRYTVKYGCPEDLVNENGLREINFWKSYQGNAFMSVTLQFCKVSNEKKPNNVVPIKQETIIPPEPTLPPDERLQEMLTAGVLKEKL